MGVFAELFLLRGIDHEGSAHFSYLIATPIITGGTVLEVHKRLHGAMPASTMTTACIVAAMAGVMALLSTTALMRYFRYETTKR